MSDRTFVLVVLGAVVVGLLAGLFSSWDRRAAIQSYINTF